MTDTQIRAMTADEVGELVKKFDQRLQCLNQCVKFAQNERLHDEAYYERLGINTMRCELQSILARTGEK